SSRPVQALEWRPKPKEKFMATYNVPLTGIANITVTVTTDEAAPDKIAALAIEKAEATGLCRQHERQRGNQDQQLTARSMPGPYGVDPARCCEPFMALPSLPTARPSCPRVRHPRRAAHPTEGHPPRVDPTTGHVPRLYLGRPVRHRHHPVWHRHGRDHRAPNRVDHPLRRPRLQPEHQHRS